MLRSHVSLCLIAILIVLREANPCPDKALEKRGAKYIQMSTEINETVPTKIGQQEQELREKLDDQIGKENELQNEKQKRTNRIIGVFKINSKLVSNISTLAMNDDISITEDLTKRTVGKDCDRNENFVMDKKWNEQKPTSIQNEHAKSTRENTASISKTVNDEGKFHENNEQNAGNAKNNEAAESTEKSMDNLLLDMALLKTKFKKHHGLYFKRNLLFTTQKYLNARVIHSENEEELMKPDLRIKDKIEGNLHPESFKINYQLCQNDNKIKNNLASHFEGNGENELILNVVTEQIEVNTVADVHVRESQKKDLNILKKNNEENDEIMHLNYRQKGSRPWDRRQLRVGGEKYNSKIALQHTTPLHVKYHTRKKVPSSQSEHTIGRIIKAKGRKLISTKEDTELSGKRQSDSPDLNEDENRIVQSLDFVIRATPTDVDDTYVDSVIDAGAFDDMTPNTDMQDPPGTKVSLESNTMQRLTKKEVPHHDIRNMFASSDDLLGLERISSHSEEHLIHANKEVTRQFVSGENKSYILKRPQLAKLIDLVETLPEGVIIITKPRNHIQAQDSDDESVRNTVDKETHIENSFETTSHKPKYEEKLEKRKQKSDNGDDLSNGLNEMKPYKERNYIDGVEAQNEQNIHHRKDFFKPDKTRCIEDYNAKNGRDNSNKRDQYELKNDIIHRFKYTDSLQEEKAKPIVDRLTNHVSEPDLMDSGSPNWRRRKSDATGSRETLGIGCVKLLYDATSKTTGAKSSRFCPKFLTKNPVTTLFLKFRWITTTQKSYHCQCCPKHYQSK